MGAVPGRSTQSLVGMRPYAATVGIAAFLFCAHSIAGGDSWRVKILGAVPGANGSTIITIEPQETAGPWAKCETARISTKFQPEPLGRRTWSRDLVTERTHREALVRIAQAAKSGAVIRFGEMGPGFKYPPTRPCELESHGLALVEENGGGKEVYSFYGAI